MRRCVIFNPVARGEKAKLFQAQLAQWARDCTLKPTPAAGAGRTLAAEAVREKFDVIIAAGGDGTLNEVLNGIADADGLGAVTFGVLPLGTVNVFAKELRIPSQIEAAWRVLQQERTRVIDVPYAEYTTAGQRVRRQFIQLAGAGFDARAVELVDWQLKKKFGPLAYLWAGCRALHETKPMIRVESDEGTAEGQMVLLGNGRFYGGRFPLFPRATLDDGKLDVTVFPKINWGIAARAGVGMAVAQILRASGAKTWQSASVRLSSLGSVPFQLDGDLVGHLPATCAVGASRLRVLIPE